MTRGYGARGARCAGPYSSGMGDHDRDWWGVDQALYRQIVSNGVEATGARFVNLSQFDAASGIISGVVWAVSQAELAERALALMRRLVPGFEIETATVDVAANPWLERIHFDGETVVAPFREIVEGDGASGRCARRPAGPGPPLDGLRPVTGRGRGRRLTGVPLHRRAAAPDAAERGGVRAAGDPDASERAPVGGARPADRGAPSLAPTCHRRGGTDAPRGRGAVARPGRRTGCWWRGTGSGSPRSSGPRIPSAHATC